MPALVAEDLRRIGALNPGDLLFLVDLVDQRLQAAGNIARAKMNSSLLCSAAYLLKLATSTVGRSESPRDTT